MASESPFEYTGAVSNVWIPQSYLPPPPHGLPSALAHNSFGLGGGGGGKKVDVRVFDVPDRLLLVEEPLPAHPLAAAVGHAPQDDLGHLKAGLAQVDYGRSE